jgi:ketosteroid isomerase-like protein
MFDAASLFFAEAIMASTKRKPAGRKPTDPRDIVRAVFKAYEKKDREAIEAVLADDFHFTSPLDNRLDRDAYFRICWPGSRNTERFRIVNLVVDGNKAFVTYEATISGKRLRNTEVHTIRRGKIAEVEVYFGWSLPHEVPAGTHKDDA